jgi:hypothetical protein
MRLRSTMLFCNFILFYYDLLQILEYFFKMKTNKLFLLIKINKQIVLSESDRKKSKNEYCPNR